MFDINKIMAAANELGIEFKTNSSNPGFHFVSADNKERIVTFDNLKCAVREKFNHNHSDIPYTTINKTKVTNKITCNVNMVNCDINLNKNSLESRNLSKINKIFVNDTAADTFNNVDISNLFLGNTDLYKVFENKKAA
ncbi:hypothetical protein [Bacillus wiedmannii]|uniref:Uncharacterized protein n=1 Tax=Bacillus wiedmannii TaxID=1890302 RepID=A0A2C4GR94_9BACI|nr:hypothetical protein [Bacillus wiedmannii]PEJ11513.1 hypothetical protein CN684_00710 [Bacillus wiedmannii]PHC62833.1 hypothetical protein COF35_27960 [Bacillus wiedmannii]